jgi:hypothetical protein
MCRLSHQVLRNGVEGDDERTCRPNAGLTPNRPCQALSEGYAAPSCALLTAPATADACAR